MADKIRIAYTFSGDGFGAANRYLSVAPLLRNRGHDVVAFTDGEGLLAEPAAIEIPTIKFKRNGMGRILWPQTFVHAIRQTLRVAKSPIWQVMREFDIVISDFEPLTYCISLLQGKPRLIFDSQHFFSRGKIEDVGVIDWLKLKTIGVIYELIMPLPNRIVIAKLTGNADIRRNHIAIFNCAVRPELNGKKWQPGTRLLTRTKDSRVIDSILKADVPADVFTSTPREDTEFVKFYAKEDIAEYTKRMPFCRGVISSADTVTMAECAHMGIPLWTVKPPECAFCFNDPQQRMNDGIAFRLGFRTGNPDVSSIKEFFMSPFQYRAFKKGCREQECFFFNDAPAIAGIIDFWLREEVKLKNKRAGTKTDCSIGKKQENAVNISFHGKAAVYSVEHIAPDKAKKYLNNVPPYENENLVKSLLRRAMGALENTVVFDGEKIIQGRSLLQRIARGNKTVPVYVVRHHYSH